MERDDIIYLALLFFSIAFGHYYRKIQDVNNKKLIGTFVGLAVVLMVSGLHILHPIICTFVNALILLFINNRYCHLVSFGYTFLHLLFFRTTKYFGIPYPPAHTNLVQMMLTLKLVGLAFEVNNLHLLKKKIEKEENAEMKAQLEDEYACSYINPGFVDIFHYAFNYVGVLTGPYYRYRTFHDMIYLPFKDYAPCVEATINKIKYVPMFAALFLFGTYFWPFSYAQSEEFFTQRSWLYRLWYITPTFFIFRMRIYIGLVLSECVCTMAALGAYPSYSNPRSGQGPTTNYALYKQTLENSSVAANEEFSFEAIHNINPYESDFCTTFRNGMKNWNMCIQYWLAVNIYKRFPMRQFRTAATMFVSAVWHGVYAGHYFCICGVPFYLPIEDIYVKLFIKENTGKSAKIWEWIIWFFKMQAFAYLAMAFHYLYLDKTLHYYNSIYHFGWLLGGILYATGLYIAKQRKKMIKSESRENKLK